ncbi:MAG: PD40 domain-containing protein [Deltaproteobacteria bacterium]|nr:PD40 domain-containing protein [Deltaproteobacteria bacterium]
MNATRWVFVSMLPVVIACHAQASSAPDAGTDAGADAGAGTTPVFGTPERLTITGWDSDAMEPFISADEQLLLFNDSNSGPDTELHWARRTGPTTFAHQGLLAGANSTKLDGVPSLSDDGTLAFVSTRSYDQTASTLYRGHFDADGGVSLVELIPGVSRNTPGIVEFDLELSRDGATLIYVVSQFTGGKPSTADLFLADRDGQGFTPRADSATLLAAVNTDALEYAPALSRDGLELYFTRVESTAVGAPPRILVSTRASVTAPFGAAQVLPTITGFVEGPTISSDGRTLYFHKHDADHFAIYRALRQGL